MGDEERAISKSKDLSQEGRMSHRSPSAKAKRAKEKEQFARKMAAKLNPIRSTICLPPGVNLDEIMWSPDRLEQLFTWLEADKKAAIEQEMAYLRRKAAEFAADVKSDRDRGLIP